MSLFRTALLAVGVAAAGVQAARRASKKMVDDATETMIRDAAVEARRRLRDEAQRIADAALRRFFIGTALKAATLLTLLGLHLTDALPAPWFWVAAAIAASGFLVRDAVVSWPDLRVIYAEMRTHGWRPRRALSEAVAARVFAGVLAQGRDADAGWTGRVALALAGETQDAVSRRIAEAVADVVRRTSWDDVRPIAVSALISAAGGALGYGLLAASAWLVVPFGGAA